MAKVGRPKRYCGQTCRKRASRQAIPHSLTSRASWVRAADKRPIQVDGSPASSTDSNSWTHFKEVQQGAGNGFGVMLGNGLGCYDLDHVSDQEARDFISSIPEQILYVERSVSGTGVHVFVSATPERGWRRVIDGLSVERYSQHRFIRVTGTKL